MNLESLINTFRKYNCRKVYFKRLAPNDNSKNQVYLGGNFDVLNILPLNEVHPDSSSNGKNTRFKSSLSYFWLDESGEISQAPDAQLILYPQYPEVRLSGILIRCKYAPSELITSRLSGRILFLGITDDRRIISYVSHPDKAPSTEVFNYSPLEVTGIFHVITIANFDEYTNSRSVLISELRRIKEKGWIDAKRFDKYKNVLPCNAPNCGGYTLESELGITPNGYSDPDFLGWEVKQFNVSSLKKWQSSVITLMTPEPTHGFYKEKGIESFIHKYGYPDKNGREARLNFGGIHILNKKQKTTNLTLMFSGYDTLSNKITDANGFFGLADENGSWASAWSFSSLILHWNRKHNNACYIPSQYRILNINNRNEFRQYHFGDFTLLCEETDFLFFLKAIAAGNIYYDPGIKLELGIPNVRNKSIKRRSQFRIHAAHLDGLYRKREVFNL